MGLVLSVPRHMFCLYLLLTPVANRSIKMCSAFSGVKLVDTPLLNKRKISGYFHLLGAGFCVSSYIWVIPVRGFIQS